MTKPNKPPRDHQALYYIRLRRGKVVKTQEIGKGTEVIVDFNVKGKVIGIEILRNAKVEF